MGLEFAWPWMFAALILPLLSARLLPRAQPAPQAALRFPFFNALQQGAGGPRPRQSRLHLLLAVVT